MSKTMDTATTVLGKAFISSFQEILVIEGFGDDAIKEMTVELCKLVELKLMKKLKFQNK